MKKIILLLIALLPLFFISCKKNDSLNNSQVSLNEDGTLPEWAIAALDKIPSIKVDAEYIILPNGATLEGFIKKKTARKSKSSINTRIARIAELTAQEKKRT
jgi:hypothetical protein